MPGPLAPIVNRLVKFTTVGGATDSSAISEVDGVLTVPGFGAHLFSSAGTGLNGLQIVNATSGAANYAQLAVTAGTSNIAFRSLSQGFTSSGANIAASGLVFADGAGGLSLMANGPAGPLRFYSGGTVERMRLSPAGVLTVSGFGAHTFSAGGTGGNALQIVNSTSGPANYSQLAVTAGTTNIAFRALSPGFATSGGNIAASGLVFADGAGGLSLMANGAAGPLRFFSGGTTERARIDAAGNMGIGTTGPGYKLDVVGDTNITGTYRVNGVPISAGAHDHVGATWNASIPWSNGAFKITNDQNGPSIWGVNTGGGNAVRGDGFGASIGVYGEGVDGPGVAGNSAGNDGISGGTSAAGKSGVYAHGHGSFNYGLFAESEGGRGVHAVDGGVAPDDSYAVYAQGDIFGTDDLVVADSLSVGGLATFNGGKVGYVVDIAQNDDAVSLEPGEVVVISGVGQAVVGEIPVIKVRRATAGEAGAVVGVVDQHYRPLHTKVQAAGQGETKAESAVDNGVILPGEYLTVVTLGAFKAVKVDASYGAITPGCLLVASPRPGYAMRATSPAAGHDHRQSLGCT